MCGKYSLVLRAEIVNHFRLKMVISARIIQKYTKFANFVRLYISVFLIHDQVLEFYYFQKVLSGTFVSFYDQHNGR